MKQFTPTEAKKLVKNILAEKKKKAEYFQANGTLKGFASAKQSSVIYPIIEDGNVFSFETETRNKISVEFCDLTSIFESFFPIYCVDIYRLQDSFHTNEFYGTKTRDTIVFIIKKFLDRFDCALVAFIDTSTDKKGKARNRLFKSWFERFGKKDFIIEPREIIFDEAESYSFLIIRKTYENADSIIEAFDRFIMLANEPEN